MGAMESHDSELDDIANQVAESLGVTINGTTTEKKAAGGGKSKGSDKGGLRCLAEWIETNEARNIIVLTGAGISTGAGIPDFRSPGTGLYDNLQKYNLPYPEAIFSIQYYRNNPEPFVSLAKELWPGITFSPTLTHSFLRLLCDKGMLRRLYTQNIDGLEFLAGIPDDKLVECHGHFRTAACIDCKKVADADVVKQTIVIEGETPICTNCGGNVKPDIVFFGESLPRRFHKLLEMDLHHADLLLVMGTSLQVAPVSAIPDMVNCRRVLFNRDMVMRRMGRNDLFIPGDCDTNVQTLADLLGWGEELAEASATCQLPNERDGSDERQDDEEGTSTGNEAEGTEDSED